MSDECKTIKVILQENGIIRRLDGLIIGRIDRSVEFDALYASQQASAPDSLKPGVLEGIAYNIEYIDAETVVFNRCR